MYLPGQSTHLGRTFDTAILAFAETTGAATETPNFLSVSVRGNTFYSVICVVHSVVFRRNTNFKWSVSVDVVYRLSLPEHEVNKTVPAPLGLYGCTIFLSTLRSKVNAWKCFFFLVTLPSCAIIEITSLQIERDLDISQTGITYFLKPNLQLVPQRWRIFKSSSICIYLPS